MDESASRELSPPPRLDRDTRFRLAIQKNRALVYTVAGTVAVALRVGGVLPVTYRQASLITGTGVVSAVLLYVYYRLRLHQRLSLGLDALWLACDMLLITWSIHVTGGATSVWFPWYLVNISAAAFTLGQRAALVVALGDTTCYVFALAIGGQVDGVDITLFRPLTLMAGLYLASFFFLRAVVELQRKTELVKALREEDRRRAEQLVEANRVKTQFLANMSHELRTPLNSIIGFSEVLLGPAGERADERTRFLGNIHGSGKHLLGLINDLLDLSKIEAGMMEFHPDQVDVHRVARGVTEVMRGVAQKSEITFALDIPAHLPKLATDEVRLRQILYNLLSNAVKFSPAGEAVTVKARHLRPDASPIGSEAIIISVIDLGVGIAAEDQQLIFGEFRQADAAHGTGGTGLGLALVKQFVELQGGTVTVKSALGKGSTFSVTLPASSPHSAEGEPAPIASPVPSRTVLVVEDDPSAYETISEALLVAGFSPLRAVDSQSALRIARESLPSAVTLDLGLPLVDSWQVLRELKSTAATQSIPVIIVSQAENHEIGFALGADDYFLKPVDAGLLTARLQELVSAVDRMRLLLIDDEASIHELLAAQLEPYGYTLDHAYTGAEGVERAGEEDYDAIILDLMMNDLDGFEVASVLSQSDATRDVPILVVTSRDLCEADRSRLEGRVSALVKRDSQSAEHLVAAIRKLDKRLLAQPG